MDTNRRRRWGGIVSVAIAGPVALIGTHHVLLAWEISAVRGIAAAAAVAAMSGIIVYFGMREMRMASEMMKRTDKDGSPDGRV